MHTTTERHEGLLEALDRQADAARAMTLGVTGGGASQTDPQAWLFTQRAHYREHGYCDPYAELMLRRAGFLVGV